MDEEDTDLIATLVRHYMSEYHRATLCHLCDIIPILNNFNKLFQKRVPLPHLIHRRVNVMLAALKERAVNDDGEWLDAYPGDGDGTHLHRYLNDANCTLSPEHKLLIRSKTLAITKLFYEGVSERFSGDQSIFEIVDPALAHTFRTATPAHFRRFTDRYPAMHFPDDALAEFKLYVHDANLLYQYNHREEPKAADIFNFYTVDSACSTKYPAWTAFAKIVLVCPTSTAEVERSFSVLSRIVTNERRSLTDPNIDVLC